MYAGWQPDADFQRQAALWGIALAQPATPEELAAFTAYWQAEGKVFHHVQWQQSSRAVCKSTAPATMASQNVISMPFQNRTKKSLMDSEVRNENVGDLMKRLQKMMPANVKPAFTTGEELLAWQKSRVKFARLPSPAKTAR